jgi:N-acetylmuramic acid 6-phosphate (MurNAc-6-P) etherase
MSEKLTKITNREIKNIIIDKDVLRQIEKTGETPFVIKEIKSKEDKITDHLIKLEIAFRNCDRFGVFE